MKEKYTEYCYLQFIQSRGKPYKPSFCFYLFISLHKLKNNSMLHYHANITGKSNAA